VRRVPSTSALASTVAAPVERAAAATAAGVFGTVAALRRDKPIHPRGVVVHGMLRRHGASEPWGSPWLDEPGEDRCLVRLSRSAGLPGPLPDVGGLAIRLVRPGGDPADLLLATTGTAPVARHLLVPRRHASRAYTSIVPYTSPRGPVMLAALPEGPRPGLSLEEEEIAAAVTRQPLRFVLAAAAPRGRWQPFGRLEVSGPPAETVDASVDFDPVVYPLPGLRLPGALARIRAAAYAGARRRTGRTLDA
jgi:hypothetical protein